jgi:hypothetical protein
MDEGNFNVTGGLGHWVLRRALSTAGRFASSLNPRLEAANWRINPQQGGLYGAFKEAFNRGGGGAGAQCMLPSI